MEHIKAPTAYSNRSPGDIDFDVFLGGSIEMGTAEPWQDQLVERLQHLKVRFFNPRRDNWDPSWTQSINNPQFAQQVNWELDALEHCDVIVFYFDPNTKSPITLMELGLYASSEKVLVCCPDGFWRRGNVEIVCDRYGIPLFETLDQLIAGINITYKVLKGIE